jgi:hypothetical protein
MGTSLRILGFYRSIEDQYGTRFYAKTIPGTDNLFILNTPRAFKLYMSSNVQPGYASTDC